MEFCKQPKTCNKPGKVMGILWYRKKTARAKDIMDVPECTKTECTKSALPDLLNVTESKNHPRISTNCI